MPKAWIQMRIESCYWLKLGKIEIEPNSAWMAEDFFLMK